MSKNLSDERQLLALLCSFEKYTIRQHTLMVYDVFAQQFPLYRARYQFRVPENVRLWQVLKFAIALHDIGKPKALAAGNRFRQHEFTISILEKAFRESGFSIAETNLAKALVSNDVIGELVRGMIDVSQAQRRLTELAVQAGMPVGDYAPLQAAIPRTEEPTGAPLAIEA